MSWGMRKENWCNWYFVEIEVFHNITSQHIWSHLHSLLIKLWYSSLFISICNRTLTASTRFGFLHYGYGWAWDDQGGFWRRKLENNVKDFRPHSRALKTGLFGFFFHPEQCFSLTIFHPEQCFCIQIVQGQHGEQENTFSFPSVVTIN